MQLILIMISFHARPLVENCSDWPKCRTLCTDSRGTLWYGTMRKAEAMPLQQCNSWLRPSATCASWELLRQWLRYARNLSYPIKYIQISYRIRNGRIILWKVCQSWVHAHDATIRDSLAQGVSFVWFFMVFLCFSYQDFSMWTGRRSSFTNHHANGDWVFQMLYSVPLSDTTMAHSL